MSDEVVYDDWEQLADVKELQETEAHNKRLKQRSNEDQINLNLSETSKNSFLSSSDGFQIKKILPRPIDESTSQFTRRPPVQMKILRRPVTRCDDVTKVEKPQAPTQIKTYAQREADYNRARQRIMGVEVSNMTSSEISNETCSTKQRKSKNASMTSSASLNGSRHDNKKNGSRNSR